MALIDSDFQVSVRPQVLMHSGHDLKVIFTRKLQLSEHFVCSQMCHGVVLVRGSQSRITKLGRVVAPP